MSQPTQVPRLSIIIATWNAKRTFERCLKSISEQSFTNLELLISDGGSTDGTVDFIKQNQGTIAWWESRKDDGIYDAWNRALGHAKGEYICFLGADDKWATSDSLALIFDAIGTQRFDLITSRGKIVDPGGHEEYVFGSAWDYSRLGRRMIVCHPGLLHHRSLFDRFGLFDIRYRIAGDLDFLLRLPADLATLDLKAVTVIIEDAGVSRRNVLARLREQRLVLARCSRYGPLRAYLAWMDKLWRYPFAKIFGIPH